jgi:serine kinase of HPr protein (carbohydrate metabolism regulator)
MRTFITSVRLKDAENPDYERLDREMEKEQFAKVKPPKAKSPKAKSRVAAGEKELTVTREYNYLGSISLQAVTAAVYRAAHRTGKQYSFTVIKQKTL